MCRIGCLISSFCKGKEMGCSIERYRWLPIGDNFVARIFINIEICYIYKIRLNEFLVICNRVPDDRFISVDDFRCQAHRLYDRRKRAEQKRTGLFKLHIRIRLVNGATARQRGGRGNISYQMIYIPLTPVLKSLLLKNCSEKRYRQCVMAPPKRGRVTNRSYNVNLMCMFFCFC